MPGCSATTCNASRPTDAVRLFILLLALAAPWAQASDEDALKLADKTEDRKDVTEPLRFQAEAAATLSSPRSGAARVRSQRLSLDMQWDGRPGPGLRASLSNRLDLTAQQRPQAHDSVNTLKEAYISWEAAPDRFLDLGRVNPRYGAATGYNPTDYFRESAVRLQTSVDPASVRANRMGSVLVRGQLLWPAGSLAALVSPRLSQHTSDATFDPALGATNNRNRWLLVASPRLGEDFNPQFMLYGPRQGELRWGLNLTQLLNPQTVGFVEISAGRQRTQLAEALGGEDDAALRAQAAVGLTYTTENKLTTTLEYDHNGRAPDRQDWNTLRAGPPQRYGLYRRWAADAQELPTRRRLFLLATWQDAGLDRLDLSLLLRHNLDDHSQLLWTEARYRGGSVDLALSWQASLGRGGTEYGAATVVRALQFSLRGYF
jgi:hypothetical protein